MKFLLKLFKTIIGVLLIPFCLGAILILFKIIFASGSAWLTWLLIGAGFSIFCLMYFLLPRPDWIYVLGHELTHALWSWSFGGSLRQIRVGSEGGHVITTRSNFLTSLAPYFFPLYVFAIIVIYALGSFFWDLHKYSSVFYFLIGFAYAFHLTMTAYILKIDQPDIKQHGYIFSGVIIFLGNLLILILGIAMFGGGKNIFWLFGDWVKQSLEIYSNLIGLFGV